LRESELDVLVETVVSAFDVAGSRLEEAGLGEVDIDLRLFHGLGRAEGIGVDLAHLGLILLNSGAGLSHNFQFL
jgi:hypothetical protein